jgi:hypothetical protein
MPPIGFKFLVYAVLHVDWQGEDAQRAAVIEYHSNPQQEEGPA